MPEFEASLTYRVRAGLLNGLGQPTAVREVTPQLGFRECEHHSDVTGQDTRHTGSLLPARRCHPAATPAVPLRAILRQTILLLLCLRFLKVLCVCHCVSVEVRGLPSEDETLLLSCGGHRRGDIRKRCD